jgi:hypothetical protein
VGRRRARSGLWLRRRGGREAAPRPRHRPGARVHLGEAPAAVGGGLILQKREIRFKVEAVQVGGRPGAAVGGRGRGRGPGGGGGSLVWQGCGSVALVRGAGAPGSGRRRGLGRGKPLCQKGAICRRHMRSCRFRLPKYPVQSCRPSENRGFVNRIGGGCSWEGAGGGEPRARSAGAAQRPKEDPTRSGRIPAGRFPAGSNPVGRARTAAQRGAASPRDGTPPARPWHGSCLRVPGQGRWPCPAYFRGLGASHAERIYRSDGNTFRTVALACGTALSPGPPAVQRGRPGYLHRRRGAVGEPGAR